MPSRNFSKQFTKLGLSAICLLALIPLCTTHNVHASHISWANSYSVTKSHVYHYSHKSLLLRQNSKYQYSKPISRFSYHPYNQGKRYRKLEQPIKHYNYRRRTYIHRVPRKSIAKNFIKKRHYIHHNNRNKIRYASRKNKRIKRYKYKRHVRQSYKKHINSKIIKHTYRLRKFKKHAFKHHFIKKYFAKKFNKKNHIYYHKIRKVAYKKPTSKRHSFKTKKISIKKTKARNYIHKQVVKKHILKLSIIRTNNLSAYQSILHLAKSKLGDSYVWGGNGPDAFDCSGFTKYIYQYGAHKYLPRLANYQYYDNPHISSNNRRPGDLVFFGSNINNITHVGMYIGNDMMIDDQLRGVIIEKITVPWWHAVGYARPLTK